MMLLSGFIVSSLKFSGRPALSKKRLVAICVISWMIFSMICCLHVLVFDDMVSGKCLFLNFGINISNNSWYSNVALYLVVNTILIVVSIYFSIKLLLMSIRSSRRVKQSGHVTGRQRSGLLILSLSGVDIHAAVISWFSVLVVPLNALTNPFIYTIKAIVIKKVS